MAPARLSPEVAGVPSGRSKMWTSRLKLPLKPDAISNETRSTGTRAGRAKVAMLCRSWLAMEVVATAVV